MRARIGLLVLALTACDLAEPGDPMPADPSGNVGFGKADGAESSDTYGALAMMTLPPAYNELIDGLDEFDEDILPHEAKLLRKQIGLVRDYVDIFVFAYDDDDDILDDLRDDLDDGYESMGAFKDLFDAQGVLPEEAVYDEDEVDELRQEVLEWKAGLFEDGSVDEYAEFIADPSLHKIHDVKKKDQPKYYWRRANYEPHRDRSGLENIGKLTKKLLEVAEEDLADTDDLRKLHKEENQIAFHDFRKSLRSVEKLAALFPQIFVEEDVDERTELLATIESTVDRYGEINDRLLAYERAHDRDDDDREEELEDLVHTMWKDLRNWQDDEDIDGVLDDLQDLIRD